MEERENEPALIDAEGSLQRIGESIAALIRRERRVTEAMVAALVKGRKQTRLRALRLLVQDGTVERLGAGRRANPYVYQFPARSALSTGPSPVSVEVLL